MEHKDPVCGMQVSNDTPFTSVHGRDKIYFCSDGCKRAYDANPASYPTEQKRH